MGFSQEFYEEVNRVAQHVDFNEFVPPNVKDELKMKIREHCPGKNKTQVKNTYKYIVNRLRYSFCVVLTLLYTYVALIVNL